MRTVNVLESMGVEYAALDVLPALDPLREATGEISDWRTFPQLYVNGELVGGCDIVEEMADSGELAELLGVDQPSEAPAAPGGEAEETASGRSAKQELQADPQQSPPMQIDRS
jgi:monothiol glutaredoxin